MSENPDKCADLLDGPGEEDLFTEFGVVSGVAGQQDGSDDDDTLDRGSVPEAQGDDAEDELLLGDEAPSSAPEPAPQEPEEQSAPQSGRRRGLVSGAEGGGKKPAPPLPQGGGTLFERMAKLSRSGAPDDEDDDDDDDGSSLNIPRFLGRQNNQ